MSYLFFFSLWILLAFPTVSQIKGLEQAGYVFMSNREKEAFQEYHRGTPLNTLPWLLSVDAKSNESLLSREQLRLEDFMVTMSEKRGAFKDDAKFLKSLYYKVHRKFLKHYLPYSSFRELMAEGFYDCLTGTALYSIILDKLGYEYQIIETNYHVYLLVQGDSQEYLFESTDPIGGFVDDMTEIEWRKSLYISGKNTTDIPGQYYYRFTFSIENSINTAQLIGLHYYNLAVKLHNQKDFEKALKNLHKGVYYYVSNRMVAMAEILLNKIAEDSMISPEDRNGYYKCFEKILPKDYTHTL